MWVTIQRCVLSMIALVLVAAGCGDNNVPKTQGPGSEREITEFSFRAANNPALSGSDITSTINGNSISVMVPFGTNVTALVATFTKSGGQVTVNGKPQISGVTENDFSVPVTYRVTAEDRQTRDYVVTVDVAPSTAKELTAFSFRTASNPGLSADVTATINGNAIAATVPFGTDVTALVATFTATGQSVTVGATLQLSSQTANDFTSPVTYRVTAADTTTRDYTVTVTIAPNTAKDITAFAFLTTSNPGLSANITATITGTAITATVPFGTDVTALVATFTTTGQSVTVGGTAQVSGTTANDFTNAVGYRVTAQDTSTRDYTVTITIAPSPAKDLTAFAFHSADNAGLSADVTGTITGTDVAVTVPFGTDVTALVATFSHTGQTVTVGGTTQVSGTTANDFTTPVIYRVTAADATTQDYTVTVTIAPGNAKDITSFELRTVDNPGLTSDVTATIAGTNITATVPFGTDVTNLVARFQHTGVAVSVGGATQTSGMTANDFTSPVTYRVTAMDASTQDYTVTISIAPNSAKDITAFAFLMADNPGLAADVTATITGTSIAATVPFGTDVTALVATFSTTGDSVGIGATPQVSGTTANDFTNPVVYTVTAQDTTTRSFTVTVTIAPDPDDQKDITAFAFLAANNPGLTADVTATITGTDIAAAVPSGANTAALVATFTHTGAEVLVNTTTQTSDVTPNDFTSPVTYTVRANNNSTKDYTVTVAISCETLAPPAHGSVSVSNGGVAPSTATYTCDRGYAVTGSATRSCTTGTYDGAAPACERTFFVVRVNDGSAAPTSASTPVFLEERALAGGTVLNTYAMPVAASGANQAFTLGGTATTEGHLQLSVNEQYLTVAGYAAMPGVASINGTTNLSTDASPVNRVVARIDGDGGVDTSTRLVNVFSAASVRGVHSVDGTAFYVSGNGTSMGPGGVTFAAFGSTGANTVLNSGNLNHVMVQIADGNLYTNSSSQLSTVGSGLPTTSPQTLAAVLTGLQNARGFIALDRSPVVTGIDTIYVARDATVTVANTLNLDKYTFDGATWSRANFTVTNSNTTFQMGFITAWPEGTSLRVVAVQAPANGHRIFTFVDDGVSTTTAATVLATAPTNTRFYGVAPAPTVAP